MKIVVVSLRVRRTGFKKKDYVIIFPASFDGFCWNFLVRRILLSAFLMF